MARFITAQIKEVEQARVGGTITTLRAALRSPSLQPCSCAKQPLGSNPSWRKAGGHVTSLPGVTK
jgi:hypothetical protein